MRFEGVLRWLFFPTALFFALVGSLGAGTTMINTRAEVSFMATLWETDTLAISGLADAQYPQFTGQWDFIFPHTSISADGDIHTDMALDATGTGQAGNNTGESPIICEVINASSTQLNHLKALNSTQATFHGIFRLYTEHANERHFELHPATQLAKWNGSTFVSDTDYRANIASVSDGATHAASTYVNLLNGSITMTATVASDNVNVTFTYPSPSVNYVQYDGTALSGVQTDSVSQYFLFQPSVVPAATVRCRLVSNTASATIASPLVAGQTLTVNALNRTDMAAVSSLIASMGPGQSATFARPVEFILLGVPTLGPAPSPSVSPSPSPSFSPSPSVSPSPSASVSPSPSASPTPSPTPVSSELLNISTRASIQAGDNVLIGGFIVNGTYTRQLLLRALGPSLTAFGVQGALLDPFLATNDPNGPGSSNDNWKDVQQSEIQATGLAPTDDRESALLTNYGPNRYTAIVSGKDGNTGVGLFEAYVLDQRTDTHVGNLSTRGFAGIGDEVLIGGFILGGGGGGGATIVVRAIGPSLTPFGVQSAMQDPTLELHDENGNVTLNDDWQTAANSASIPANLQPSDSRESALLVTLSPGRYTAIVQGKSGATGVALVEVYKLN